MNTGASGINSLVAKFATSLLASSQVSSVIKDGAGSVTSALSGNTFLSGILNTPNKTSGSNNAPNAYLNILFFDEQFKLDENTTTVITVEYLINTKVALSRMAGNAVTAKKNGYVYVYFRNESDELVYFDNFMLSHELSSLREETHYYPFGLTMAGISSRALHPANIPNKNLFNGGSELQNKEFSDGTGWEMYATQFRNYDPQIGRFHQTDPLSDMYASLSAYTYGFNNPILFNDPMGLKPKDLNYTEASRIVDEGGGGAPSGGWLDNPYKRVSHFNEPAGASYTAYAYRQTVNDLINTPYGGSATSDGNGGFTTTNLFGSQTEALAAGIAYTDFHETWGQYGTSDLDSYVDTYHTVKSTSNSSGPGDLIKSLVPGVIILDMDEKYLKDVTIISEDGKPIFPKTNGEYHGDGFYWRYSDAAHYWFKVSNGGEVVVNTQPPKVGGSLYTLVTKQYPGAFFQYITPDWYLGWVPIWGELHQMIRRFVPE